jgi:pyruvate/2-oxoglutarate dehydrogenase complex dihydrolipoamide acyltransferase (E2) component
MTMLRVADDLWADAVMPQGALERWKVADGALVQAGQTLAEIRIEDAVHDVIAPISGRLFRTVTPHDTLEPGSLLGFLRPL